MPPRPPLVLDVGGPCAQCKCCRMWNNLRDLGRVEPGVCVYCDELKELRGALDEVRGMLKGLPDGEAGLLRAAAAEVAEAVGSSVRAMRAGLM